MNKSQIIAIYTQDQRYEAMFPGYQRDELPRIVRHLNTSGRDGGFITYSSLGGLDDAAVDQIIREQIDWFAAQGQGLEWKYYDYDLPSDLKDRLAAHGFEIEDAEAIMVLPVADVPESLLQPVPSTVMRLTSTEQLVGVRQLEEAVWKHDFSWITDHLAQDMLKTPDQISVYAAYVDGQVVSSAWMYFTHGSRFAGLWGGSTLKEYRKQGLYTALLAVRMQEAKARGVDFLTVDAGPMSRPILEKLGFLQIAVSHPCKRKLINE